MAEYSVSSFADLHTLIVKKYDPKRTIFRGAMSAEEHDLTPLVGRIKFIYEDHKKEEKLMFIKFKERAIPFLEINPRDEWDWLSLAQHHGLPTRLLDWTLNPLVAAYFAVENLTFNGDSIIYAIHKLTEINSIKMPDPFAVDTVMKYVPRHITRRITVQAGLFTIHPEPNEPYHNPDAVDKIIIRNGARRELKKTLYWYGIHSSTLFPDLDGLAKHIRYLKEDTRNK